MLIVDNFRGKNLDLSKCQGTLVDGDNPLDTYSPLFVLTLLTTFPHRYGYVDSVMTNLFPLTTPTGPVFYYIYFLAKKGVVSVGPRETNVVSVLTPLQRIRMGFYGPYEVTITVPFNE